MVMKSFTYSIDSQDRLITANSEWDAFALENYAPELAFERIKYASLWDFIYDTETRHIYRLILEKVRNSTVSVRLPFRCDSPDRRRFMEMEMLPLEAMAVMFNTSIIREEKREPVKLLDAFTERSEQFIRMCSWCKCVILDDGSCMEVEEAVRRRELFNEPKLPRITHGACAVCSKKWFDEIGSRRSSG
ncbi:MAG: hypothetical protein HYV24_12630 [Deltaproteobacteria bacterium]|nr:hypothetical protein [Deltaproteobacteria bacterium]